MLTTNFIVCFARQDVQNWVFGRGGGAEVQCTTFVQQTLVLDAAVTGLNPFLVIFAGSTHLLLNTFTACKFSNISQNKCHQSLKK